MPQSIRDQIVEAFAARLNAERAGVLDSEEELPKRVLWDPAESAKRVQYGKIECTVGINVAEMAVRDTAMDASKQGNAMVAALLEDALNADSSLGGLCSQINYSDSELDTPDDGQQTIVVLVTFDIVYRISNTSPYQQ